MAGIGIEQGQRSIPQIVECVSDSRVLDGLIVFEPECLQVIERPGFHVWIIRYSQVLLPQNSSRNRPAIIFRHIPGIGNAMKFGDGRPANHFRISRRDHDAGRHVIGFAITANHQSNSAALLLLTQLRVGNMSPAWFKEKSINQDDAQTLYGAIKAIYYLHTRGDMNTRPP